MKLFTQLTILLLLLLAPFAQATWQDADNAEFAYSARPVYDRVNRQYSSIVTITNTGSEISAPLRVIFDASSHQIMNASGTDHDLPFINLEINELAAGATHKFTVKLGLIRASLSLEMRLQADIEVDSAPNTGLQLADNQIAIFYQREDANYQDWGLHLWNGEGCGDYSAPTSDSSHFANWGDPYPADGEHPVYGAYYILTIDPGAACYNFILHKGDNKALGNNNSSFEPVNGQEAFTFHGYPELWYEPLASRPFTVDGAKAHWINTNTLVWLTSGDAVEYRLYSSADASLSNVNDETLNASNFIPLTMANVDSAVYAQDPQLNGFNGFTLNLSAEQAKQWAKQQLLAVAIDAQGELVEATRVQLPRLLDSLYTSAANDADEATLGVTYNNDNITAALWAPTAQAVNIEVYDSNKQILASYPMALDNTSGVWSYTGSKLELDRHFYRYQITAYHPLTEQIEELTTTDPYSVSLATNGRYSQFVHLEDLDLKPANWDDHTVPTITDPEDAVIYEGHIRDFSILDSSTSAANRGKYMAFTELNSAPMQHLQGLQQAGLTHFHVLPANDIASIQEDTALRVDVTDTVAKLCQLNNAAPICEVEDNQATILQILESYDPSSTDAQTLVDSMRSLDGFNWGYDPQHFAAPEGSYATNSDGVSRILEMRAMNQSLHQIGLRVVLDVVYNHTASSGLYDNSVLDKVVPGYYQRLNETSGQIENSTCCENTATEHKMMAKLMNDSLVSFAEHFGFDGFRFDLMGHIPRQAIIDAREAVRAVDPDTYFYGEGWNFGEVANNRRFEQASQLNMAGTEIGTYSDRQRDAVRDAALFTGGSISEQDVIRIGLVGNVGSYQFVAASDSYLSTYDYQWNGQPAGYSIDPADTVNYISKHDNETLWDKLQYALPTNLGVQARVRIQNVALSIPLLSQGIPFLHMGSDLIRSKSMDRNTYDAGDWFNRVDFTQVNNNWNIGLPLAQDNQNNWSNISPISANTNTEVAASDIQLSATLFKEFLQIRSASKLFRLNSAQDIAQRVKFHNTGSQQIQGLIVMSIDDGLGLTDLDSNNDAIVVLINGNASSQSINVTNATGFELHQEQQQSADTTVQSATFNAGTFNVPGLTTAVFVKPQNGAQGYGLSALPPYGEQSIYLRGDFNGWDTSLPFSYQGNDTYELDTTLLQDDYQFKIANQDFSDVNLGGGFTMPVGSAATLTNGGNNLSLSLIAQGSYKFVLDAADNNNPILTITPDDPNAIPPPYGNHVPLLRGDMNSWGINSPLSYEGNGIYRGVFNISAGGYNFKIADQGWGDSGGPNLGANTTVELDTAVTLYPGSNDNLYINLQNTADLVFELDANNLANPSLTVTEQPE
ncbi:pullulanase-type alpha-1,6-glucosidase [Paraglaciecola arctica]|uniref:pullulanase-type alpha-1,6-glucosidase n=1 Tax=Paraglaciecola arctica TaxID=1128911 RepID=UPI001C0747BE|nr:pullulanase-type alpha-1,6-glucosidase [Paraglaciecola arctica]MBU3001958.1 pullulanase-type alpha-1,6-glucosidase [Paraglaciecola arctica]